MKFARSSSAAYEMYRGKRRSNAGYGEYFPVSVEIRISYAA